MKCEWGAFLRAVAAGLILCTGCATVPTPKPETPTPPTTAQAGSTTVVAVAPPAPACCPKQTLPDFLGISALLKGAVKGLDHLRNLLGSRFPGLEATPPLLAITDPANSGPKAPPAVKAAAEIKAEEDAAPQKIKALRYLSRIGCAGCYPGVEEGLLAALDDCTESVRFEAVKAIRETVGNPCQTCRKAACCTPKLRKRLDKIAHEMDNEGCYKEASPRVRRLARVALMGCGGFPPEAARPTVPTEGPATEPGSEKPTEAPPATAPAKAAGETPLAEALSILTSSRQPAAALSPHELAIAAAVNGEAIFFRELTPLVEQRLATDPWPAGAEQTSSDRLAVLRSELQRVIDRKLICQDARRHLPPAEFTKTSFRREGDGPATPPPAGEALAAQDEESLANQWLARWLQVPETCSRQELFAHYRANLQKYQASQRLRWEQATARFERFPSPDVAAAALNCLRSTLAHQPSQPPRNVNLDALDVRTVDWTECADLPSGVVAQALATLPVGELSPVLRDGGGLHLVRVLERTTPDVRTLDEVADAVREDVLQLRRAQARQVYLRSLRERATIWTYLDTAPAAGPLVAPTPAPARTATGDPASFRTAPPVAASADGCPCRR